MGCFWGAERIFWQLPGVVTTAAGYMGGFTPNPTYEETCTGRTGHAEAVQVVYDPAVTSPSCCSRPSGRTTTRRTRNRQGNDVGTAVPLGDLLDHRRSTEAAAGTTRAAFQDVLDRAGRGEITTELAPASEAGPFYYAEDYHQQYLHKNPGGYCNHGPNGLTCPVGVANLPAQTDVLPPA